MTQPATSPTSAEVRAWALAETEFEVGARGRLSSEVIEAYNKSHPRKKYQVAE